MDKLVMGVSCSAGCWRRPLGQDSLYNGLPKEVEQQNSYRIPFSLSLILHSWIDNIDF